MLADDLTLAGAVVVPRDGRFVVAHYGSVSAEESVCRKHVGIAVRSDHDVLELTGRPDRLELALSRLLGGHGLLPGQARRAGRAWCVHADPERALIVGPPVGVAAFRRLATHSSVPVACDDRSAFLTAFALVGPRARALLAAAGLPADLAPAAARVSWWCGERVLSLRERGDRHLLLVTSERAGDAWHELVTAGRPLELSCVGVEALDRLAAVTA
jgi:glycine cleavage system aminomethyltransferase T